MVSLHRDEVCAVCGAPKQTGRVCRVCAFHLVDLALSSIPDDGNTSEPLAESGLAPDSVRLSYDHYQVCRSDAGLPLELGRGSMGITYQAIDTNLGCPVALKIINARYLPNASARDRFLREARTAAGLRHPNIASVFHLGLGERDCFYAMEYIAGETLEARVRREGALPWPLALDIISQAARALQFAHEHRFVHRDIKPTNMMLVEGSETVVKLIDFGLVKALADQEANEDEFGYFVGTPHFASPEQLESGTVDVRSDIYSLGRCLQYALTGSPAPAAARSEKGFPSTSIGAIPAPVRDLLRTMVSSDPTLRPQTAAALLQKIEKCRSQTHFTGKRRLLWASVALTIVVLAVAAVFKPGSIPSVASPRAASLAAAHLTARVLYAQAEDSMSKDTAADNQHAISLYQRAISLEPGDAATQAGLASAYFHNVSRFSAPADQLDLAIAHGERAIALDAHDPRAYTVLGSIRSFQGRHWEALGLIHRGLELNPRFPQAMRSFCLLWCSVGQPQFGLPWAMGAAQIEPARVGNLMAAGDASADLCADKQAESFYQRYLQIDPLSMAAHCGLIHLHLLQGNFPRALQDCAEIESVAPGLNLPLTLKAQIFLFSGNYVDAEIAYDRLLAMDRGGLINFYGGVSYLSAAGFLRLRAGNVAAGNALLHEASDRHLVGSEGPQAAYDLAAIRCAQGNAASALVLLRQAIRSGWLDYRATRLDPRFESLRGESSFQNMLQDLSNKIGRMREEAGRLSSKPLQLSDYPVRAPPE